MAETEQPKKGSTSKFQDTLGKTDALIYNALGVNVESLLAALGIKSLKDIKNIDFTKINWGSFLAILYALNPRQLKALLSKFSFSNFSLRSLPGNQPEAGTNVSAIPKVSVPPVKIPPPSEKEDLICSNN